MNRYIFIVLMSLILIIGCSSRNKNLEKYTELKPLFGAEIRIDVCVDPKDIQKTSKALEQVWQRLEEIQWKMNIFDQRSDVIKVNQSYPHAVTIGADTYQLMKDAKEFTKLTNGAFDITVWPIIDLWKKSAKVNRMPSQTEINAAKDMIGTEDIEFLSQNQIRLKNPHIKTDLGGIAAGYGVDQAVQILHELGIRDFLIDAAGDMYAGGKNCQGNLWRIGVGDPKDRSKIVDVVLLSNQAVTTSGDYERYVTINGQKMSHIIDPRTGFPQKSVISATVIGPTTQDADALATALCVLDPEEGTKLIDSLGKKYASMLVYKTPENKQARLKNKTYSNYQIKYR